MPVRSHQHLQRHQHQAQHQELVSTTPAADDDDLDTSFRITEPVDPLDERFQPGISSTSSYFETSQDSQNETCSTYKSSARGRSSGW
ncbi:hypothetical protein J4Q44_G00344890 [Coregonus suidteri]|uniref:Uncharacterized protein n=1 Tax=Coregonus suidteri TaxID=861788 RepID=A0AAN8QG49_9TELE